LGHFRTCRFSESPLKPLVPRDVVPNLVRL